MEREEIVQIIEDENDVNIILSQQQIYDIADESRMEINQNEELISSQSVPDAPINEPRAVVSALSPTVMQIRCSPSPQSVPEMLTQPQSITENEEVVLIFDDSSINGESYERVQSITSLPNTIQFAETLPNGETELQVVPESAFSRHVTSSDGTQLVVMPVTCTNAQEVPVSSGHDEETPNQVTWQRVDDVSGSNEDGMNLLCDAVVKEEEEAGEETRVMAYDSRTGEIVDMEALRGEMDDGQVTYLVQDENDEDGASYRIVTDEQLRQMQEPEMEGSFVLENRDEIGSFVEEKVDDMNQFSERVLPEVETVEENDTTRENEPQIIDIGSDVSVISPDNMQALLQILQSLPMQGEGQTLQVVLQGNSDQPQVFQLQNGIAQAETTSENDIVHLVQMVERDGRFAPSLPVKRKTTNIAVQATPDNTRKAKNRVQTSGFRGRRTTRPVKSEKKLIGKSMTYTYMSDDDESDIMSVSYPTLDYPSEQDDAYSSAQEVISGAVPPKSDFMEDYLEVQFDGKNLLSSTLDESVVESPFNRKVNNKTYAAVRKIGTSINLPVETITNGNKVTLIAKTYEQVIMEGKNLAEASYDESDPFSRPPRYTRGLRTLPRRTLHRCGYCEYESRDKWMVAQHCRSDHEGEIVRVMTLVPECSRRQCPYCKKWFNYAEFFQHMRFSHNDVHPFKCFYCDFQGRDRNQVKHHICKKHAKPARIINLMRDSDPAEIRKKGISEGEESIFEYVTEDEDDECVWDEGLDRKCLSCPECKKSFKSLKYLKTHIKMHRPNRFQCGYCDYIATLEHQILKHSLRKHGTAEPRVVSKELEPEKNPLISRDIDSVVRRVFSMSLRQPKDEDPLTWARKWTCPHCDYTCQFGASFRRHIRMHANLLPFKCNYCSFKGREKYYVRRHIARMHRGLPEIVVDNTAENRAGDTSSDEDYQEKGLRRRRKRKTKNVLKAVVPVATPTPNDVHVVVKKEVANTSLSDDDDMEEESEISFDKADYIARRVGDDVICKVCEGKVRWKDFEKHVMKHESSYGCVYCDYSANDRTKVRAHVLSNHPSMPFCVVEDVKENASNFHCPICQQLLVVSDEAGLREHFYMHYDYKPYTCGLCDFCACSKETVVAHGEVTHGEVMEVIVSDHVPPDGLEDTIKQFVRVINANEELVSSKIMDEVVSLKRKRGRPPKTVRTTMRRFECPICHCTTNRHAATVRRHLYSHFDYRPYVCGYCGYRTFSDNDVRQHIVNSHGKVLPKVSISDERTPPELESLLASVNEQLNNGSSKYPVSSDPTSLVTDEGKRWHDILSRGVCPWCDEFVGHFRPTAYRHLKTHFQCKPYRCGHCTFRGSERMEIKQHSSVTHPNENVSVVGPSIKMAEIEDGLRRYLQSHPNVLEKTQEEMSDDLKGESEEAVRELVEKEKKEPEDENNTEQSIDKISEESECDKILEEKSDQIDVPIELLEDVCYLLQLSCLPQDIPLTRRRITLHRCEYCKHKFRKASDLREHIMSEHPSDVTAYSCCYCDYWNFNKTFVKNHILSSHPGRRILIKEKVYDKKRRASESSDEDGVNKCKMEENSLTLVQTSVEELPIKRKRGRPPKIAAMQELSDTKEINVVVRVDSSPSVKRGRPKKVPLISQSCVEVNATDDKNMEKSDSVITVGLENLEECDENLPKVLHILTLP